MISLIIIIILFGPCLSSNICRTLDDYCSCDSKCTLYGDCCPGHSDFGKTGDWNNMLTCKSLSKNINIWIIDRCPSKNHQLEDLCTNKRILPTNRLRSLIAVKSDSGDVYANMFCAKCHGQVNYQYIDTAITCPGTKLSNFSHINDLVNGGYNCSFRTQPVSGVRYCNNDFIRHCPKDDKINKTIVDYCETKIFEGFENIMKSNSTTYRNKYCCMCWNKTCRIVGRKKHFQFNSFTYFLNYKEWDTEPIIDFNATNLSASNNRTITKNGDYILNYVYIILTLLSILALIILISIYTCYSVFHNFGGYLTLCLSSCLLLMNIIMLLIKIDYIATSNFCQIIGIVQHFIAISNFIWMSIYALDLMQTFVFRSTGVHETKSPRTFVIYCVFGFGLDAIIVGLATIIEFSLPPESIFRPKYGGRNCWFRSKVGGIIWYFGPVCILLAWNFVACVLVFYKILQTSNECKVARGKKSNNRLWLCVRLTALFGLVYILQIIAVLSNVRVLIIVGSMLNCLQGCLLALCFLWTKRVKIVVRSSWPSITGSKYNTANTSLRKESAKPLPDIKDTDRIPVKM